MLQYFTYEHLPAKLQAVSKPFCDLAVMISDMHTDNDDERNQGLRKLLEAKDCAVRASL